MRRYMSEKEAVALSNPKQFILAGKAFFTVKNETTGNRFTFKVTQAKKENPQTGKQERQNLWFVSLLTGCNNETHYTYMGILANGIFRWTGKSPFNPNTNEFKVFDWLWKHLEKLPEQVKFYHEGRCGRCGKLLTVPESILSGFGPECAGRVK